ncbi:MAG: phosphatidate cytidylyltransferase, partial [Candidatus Hodarchaeales archaeon]
MDQKAKNDVVKDQSHEEIGFFNELLRKSVHLSVFAIPLAYHWLKIELGLIQLALLLIVCIWLIPMEIYRLKINPNTWVNYLTRSAEKEGIANYLLTTMIWFVVLLGVSLELYRIEIAELALVATVMGDSGAAIIGRGIGNIKLPYTKRKTVEGYIAGVSITYLIGFVFLLIIDVPDPFLPLLPTIALGI